MRSKLTLIEVSLSLSSEGKQRRNRQHAEIMPLSDGYFNAKQNEAFRESFFNITFMLFILNELRYVCIVSDAKLSS